MSDGPSIRGLDVVVSELQDDVWTRRVEALRTATARLIGGELGEADEVILAPHIVKAAKDEKWEVRKAAALALAELRHGDGAEVQRVLDALVIDPNRWVSQAAERAVRRVRSRSSAKGEWSLTAGKQDPTLQYIAGRIREIGLRSMTPARIYELAIELGEQSYRDLAADTAHEMRTLLTPLQGYLGELRRHLVGGGASDAKSERYLSAALLRVDQIEELIVSLKLYGSPKDADFVPVDLLGLVNDAVGIGCERAMRSAPSVEQIARLVEVPADIIVDAIRERLMRAIANLVSNALEAMRDGGTLTIRARQLDGDRVELVVMDTGHGMSPEEIEQARQRFHTTRRDEGGTGLGLPIAERIIVTDHLGELSIDSAVGRGTTMTVTLPVRRTGER